MILFLATAGPGIIVALSFHEFCHAYVAYRFGDLTAARMGRLTLNPLRHLDPIGTLLIFVAGFGWAKPVPVNPGNLQRPRQDMLWIAAAGPGSNFLLALLSGILFQVVLLTQGGEGNFLSRALLYSVYINLILAFFNLIPLVPLDGASILKGIMNNQQAALWSRVERFGPILLIALVFSGQLFGFSLLGSILGPPVGFFLEIFTGGKGA
ncbi:MAG: site-2 protease family protein [Candidatus Eisenbacteria bacterium]|uniref:Site-2 protease family protein n=1 Tax=Eiseniibacteriota bacterium TaxID=2212470 RepID=A0A7Y2EDR2_UNCEI|nr:site-2 protease family protein [Candidatus Eisenbacteria bacterium]